MTSIIEMDPKNRKRTLLKFLLGKPDEQPILFRQIINYELIKHKQIQDEASEFKDYNDELKEQIYNSKLKEVERQTNILKAHILAQSNNEKYKSVISIIERKLYIVEMQIDIGVYNLMKNRNVKFYFEV